MNTKICTDLEQSKKLIELGIDRKSSDMYYWCGEDLRIGGYKAQSEEFDIPAWSLSALLCILPSASLDSSNDHHFRLHCMEKFSEWYDNPIDVVFEMIIRLKENGKI